MKGIKQISVKLSKFISGWGRRVKKHIIRPRKYETTKNRLNYLKFKFADLSAQQSLSHTVTCCVAFNYTHFMLGCVSFEMMQIRINADHSALKDLMNPCPEWIHRFQV